ncbi:hypothetical protein PBI_DRMANHATTAN_49 [Arthrobacter phage DrManhattan]|uniref:Uncharacterized protein n=2 Tax=Manhattanvirus drmanhattan TaxID=2734250 RepID=A0A3G2KFK8_9CAUD|nr:hypothetical protein HOU48_gp49 [Arthrobacter phage DrManhattan]AYN57769.1 hypothetical protein PBI_DRMANHATTAN_49 [Arthrobacter phage DrManhattan]QHB36632.1 hypothetical protein SEA_ADOLIN_50 [Arthrobacter phage Adolin]
MNTFTLTTGETVELDAKWTHITECIGRDGEKHFMASKHRNEAAAAKFLAKEAARYGFTPVKVHAAN